MKTVVFTGNNHYPVSLRNHVEVFVDSPLNIRPAPTQKSQYINYIVANNLVIVNMITNNPLTI